MFKIGMKLTIETFKNGEVESRFQCRIVDITQNYLCIDYPIDESTGRTSLLLDGSEFTISFVGEDGNVYQFSSEVKGRKKLKIPVLLILIPVKNEIQKIQRREYVRVDVSLDVAIHPQSDQQPLITRTVDISGGGLAVVDDGTARGYKPGDVMDITVVLPFASNHYSYFMAKAELIRFIDGWDQNPAKITYQFINMNDKQRDKIIKYCFEKQLEERRKIK
ncbi:flagellar brake protein [Piscibacillus halophilus]|uniref:flagellar brake protein n=1 Tax=Piscibacillus halophilus TaxID=571933 RepID=UPI0015888A0C|nr:flagellar brake domain-containing protein [Piscibacillus halophilus]